MRSLLLVTCLIGCTGGPPEGGVHGTLAGRAIDVELDATSTFVLQRSPSCAMPDTSVFSLSYGGGQVEVDFRIAGGPSVFADITYTVPAPANSALIWFSVGSGMLERAELAVGITGLRGRRDGTFHLELADGSVLDGDFDMPFEASGDRAHCGGGGDGWDD